MINILKKWEQNSRRRMRNLFWFFFGHRDYKRFVIIANERTGSSMLASYLNAHPAVECHGEVFRFLHGDSLPSRWKMYFSSKPRAVQALGFKMLYSHPKDGSREGLIHQIQKWPDPLIIHLTRAHTLQMLASLRIAEATSVWGLHVSKDPLPLEARRVYISPDDVRMFRAQVEADEQRTEALFGQGDYIRIRYEDLIDQPQDVLSILFSRLGVEDIKVTTPHQKINTEPLDQLIVNYDELRQEGLV